MDPYLLDVTRRLDSIEIILRGDGADHPGLAEIVRRLRDEQQRQGTELADLRAVPHLLASIQRESGERLDELHALTKQVANLVQAQETAEAVAAGERKAMDRIARWLKVASGLVALIAAGGGIGILRALQLLAEAVP